MNRNSKSTKYLLAAVERGYKITKDGRALGPKGNELKAIVDTNGYKLFFVWVPAPLRKRGTVRYYHLQAYQKYGDQIFDNGDKSIHVRHLNSDPLDDSWENIAIGTPRENMMDKPASVRRKVAKYAARHRRKLTDEQASEIRTRYSSSSVSMQDLADEYHVAPSTIFCVIHEKTYAS